MVAPKEGYYEVIGVAEDLYIFMKVDKMFLCVLAVIINCHFWLLIDNYIDDNSSIGCVL
jgi:hypothetical protein